MMNESNSVINAGALAIVPAKRKRSRPRKYPALEDQNSLDGDRYPINGGDNLHAPPGYRGSNGSKSHRVGQSHGLSNGRTGQAVSGFIEAEFDGGYLLTVRVRNSDTILKGVVFSPGCFDPVSLENDVAPNVHMIKRNERPFFKGNYGRTHGKPHGCSKGTNFLYPSGSLSVGSVPWKSKLMPPPPLRASSSLLTRGDVVPVVLQPVTSTNVGPFVQNQLASVGKLDSLHLSPQLSKETQPVALQVVYPNAGSAPSKYSPPKFFENGPQYEPSAEASYEVETKPIIAPPPGFCKNSQAFGKSSSAMEDRAVPKPPEDETTGKLTELLQAVQEGAMKRQMTDWK
ncbi:hypothetical protein SAY86_003574 [Trapa natans]|uniref:Uncharacterized protein n=1 Tax=Trapa natans TaxID=22666 RepID=A0AAN7MEE2_TRANT|nr:hypothetical protein SAY86_003574 [Trapa natans]